MRGLFGMTGTKLAGALFAAFFGPVCAVSLADPFKGGAAQTEASPVGAKANPANAAFVRQMSLTLFPRIYERSNLKIRYPGFSTVEKDKNGVGLMPDVAFIPIGVDGVENRIGFAVTEILPPVGINMVFDNIPIVIFDQVNNITVNAEAQVKLGFGGLIAYRVAKNFGVGLGFSHRQIAVDAVVVASETGDTVVNAKLDMVQTDLTIGARWVVLPGRLVVGASALAFSQNQNKMDVTSPLLDPEAGAPGSGGGSGGAAAPNFFNKVAAGVSIHHTRAMLQVDVEYKMASQGERMFSLVDFEEKPRDTYDTISLRGGAGIDLGESRELAVGYANVPSAIGQGGRGEGSKTGFGLTDILMISAGLEELKPYQLYVAGLRQSFGVGKREVSSGRKGKRSFQYFHPWTVGFGLGYQQASLGIDENGEQPGAYLQTKLFFPLEITYKM